MKKLIASTIVLGLFLFSSACSSARADLGDFGLVYECPFPFSVKVDGDLADWPRVTSHFVSHEMGWNLPENDKDGSFEFSCLADREFLYIAILVSDDEKCVDENIGGDVYQDDSVEVYIDGDNSKATEYEPDVSQITIGRYNLGEDPASPMLNAWTGNSGQGMPADQTGTMVAIFDVGDDWGMEVAIPLDTFDIKPEVGTVIGFNIQLNDDDDGGGRDHKLSWSEKEREGSETAYFDPSVFGELKFIKAELAVSFQADNLTATWGSVKQ